jgi:uncharacterized protein
MKFLTWLLIILAALMFSRLFNARQAAARRATSQPAQPARTAGGAEPMVRCAHCGIYMPRSEALLIGRQTWCSEEHARLGIASNQQS